MTRFLKYVGALGTISGGGAVVMAFWLFFTSQIDASTMTWTEAVSLTATVLCIFAWFYATLPPDPLDVF